MFVQTRTAISLEFDPPKFAMGLALPIAGGKYCVFDLWVAPPKQNSPT